MGDRVGVEIYNAVKTEVEAVELKIGRSWRSDADRRDVVRKATSGRRGHLGPNELGSREDADKMQ